jgi:type III pantothenate kinase
VILDIDAGNTRIKWRVTDGNLVIARGETLTASVAQADPLEIDGIDGIDGINRIRLACVSGNQIVENLHNQLTDKFGIHLELAEVTDRASSVICGYRDHTQLGVDRWLALVAAYAKENQAVIVVDAGSAVTVEIVCAEGVHQGGYIVPGLRLMHEVLWQGTDRIKVEAKPIVEISEPGLSTDEAVDKGCILMLVSMVESLAAKYQSKLIVTGGDGSLLSEALNVDAELYPDLVLEGLALEGIGLRAVEG